ncbi:CDP-alcohol phosphatidyltransferase family protein [Actinomadura sp. 9N407]|uniref:CDP-alcohol phosphatidyltransferase family protein n=1 Tax=Actinomadura sp. 9N407 TaxID=3375154 RepID=UPI0037ABFC45
MTVAVITVTGRARGGPGPGSAAALPYPDGPPTLLARLCDQLTTLNVPEVHVVGRPEFAAALRADGHFVTESADVAGDLRELARLARTAREPIVLLPADLIIADEALAGLLDGADPPIAALTVPARYRGSYGMADARVEDGRVVTAGSAEHVVPNPNAAFPGVLRIAPSLTKAVADVATELADLPRPDLPRPDTAEAPMEAVDLLLVGLVRSGMPVAVVPGHLRPCHRARDEDGVRTAREALEKPDDGRDDAARLAAAVKSNDGFFATFAVSSYSPYIVRWAAVRGVSPTSITALSMVLAVLAAMWFAAGTRTGMVTGAVIFYFSFVLDCVDGQLARYSGRTSLFGAWLDSVCDRAKEYVVYAGLAVGSTVAAVGSGPYAGDVWGLAVAVLILQIVRHMVDFSYGARGKPPLTRTRVTEPLMAPGVRPPTSQAAGALALWIRVTSRARAFHWAKKMIVLPIGERFALIAVTAALADARVTFLALLIWGGIAASYTLAGRMLRSVAA